MACLRFFLDCIHCPLELTCSRWTASPSHSLSLLVPSPSNRLTFLGSTLFAGVAFNKACFDMQTTMLTTRPQRVLRRRTLETKQNTKKRNIIYFIFFTFSPSLFLIIRLFCGKAITCDRAAYFWSPLERQKFPFSRETLQFTNFSNMNWMFLQKNSRCLLKYKEYT